MRFVALLSLCLISTSLLGQELPKHEGSDALKQIKGLVGTWTGKADHGHGPQKVTLVYRVTAGGSAVIETFNPGSPMEMVTVYHDRGGKLEMTHYCMLGNQPHMQLAAASDDAVAFKLAANSGVEKGSTYMSGLKIEFVSENKIKQTWSITTNGETHQGPAVEMTREK